MGKTALLVQTALLGDSAFSGKLISALESLEFDVLCRNTCEEFYKLFPNVRQVYGIEKRSISSIFDAVLKISKFKYDAVISFTSSLTGRVIATVASGKKKFFIPALRLKISL